MAQNNDTYLKTKYENGDIPNAQDFIDFIDSKANNILEHDIRANTTGNPSVINADGVINITDAASLKDKNGNVIINDSGVITGTITGMSDKEDKSNKENIVLDTSTTKYPTNRLVKENIDSINTSISNLTAFDISTTETGISVQDSLNSKQPIGSYELQSNKENITLDNSPIKYPTNRLVRQEIDAIIVSGGSLQSLSDVHFETGEPLDGDMLIYDANISKWKPTRTSIIEYISTPQTLVSNSFVTFNTSSSGDCFIPSAVSNSGLKIQIKNIGTGIITLFPLITGETIDNRESFILGLWEAITLVSNGSIWMII